MITPSNLLLPLKTALDFGVTLIQSLGLLTPRSAGCIFLLGCLENLGLLMPLNIPSFVYRKLTMKDVPLVTP